MRASVVVAVLAASTGVAACTAILGDFTLDAGSSQPGGDASDAGGTADTGQGEAASSDTSDAAQAQILDGSWTDAADGSTGPTGDVTDGGASDSTATTPGDGSSPDGAPDAGDAAPALYRLRCGSPASAGRIQVTTGALLRADRLAITGIAGGGNGMVRVALVDYVPQSGQGGTTFYNAVLRAYTIDAGNSQGGVPPPPPVSLPTGTGQILAFQRYGGPSPGFVALYPTFDPTTSSGSLSVARIADSASVWTGPTRIAAAPPNLNNVQASLFTVDGASDDYYVILSWLQNGVQTVAGARVRPGGNDTLGPVATYSTGPGQNAFNLLSPGIATSGSPGGVGALQPYVILSPNGSNGPPPLGAPAQVLVPGQSPAQYDLRPPSNLNYLPVGLDNAMAAGPSQAEVAIMQADLTQLQVTYRIGQLPPSGLPALDPMRLPPTPVTAVDGGAPSLKDVIVFNPSVHWEVAGGRDQLLMLAPPVDFNASYPGVNLGWWDGDGTVRAYAAGDGALLADVANLARADATFASLVGSIGQLWVAYQNASVPASMNNPFPPPPGDLWIARVNCSL